MYMLETTIPSLAIWSRLGVSRLGSPLHPKSPHPICRKSDRRGVGEGGIRVKDELCKGRLGKERFVELKMEEDIGGKRKEYWLNVIWRKGRVRVRNVNL